MELKKIKDIVIETLKQSEVMRGNDDLLYLEVLKKIHPHWNNGRITTNIENISLGEFFSERKAHKLPSFESIRRSRQKAQEENKNLRPSEKVQKARKIQEENFYKFAKNQEEFSF